MSRAIAAGLAVWMLLAGWAAAQDYSVRARIVPDESQIRDEGRGVRLVLGLSQGVPWRIFTLDEPRRLVLDFREVDWTGLDTGTIDDSDGVETVRVGVYRPGWSRMVVVLTDPMSIDKAGLTITEDTGAATLELKLVRASEEDFAANAGAPRDPRWDLPEPAPVAARPDRGPDDPLMVVIDPGHGGIDPGAERGDTSEKALMLAFARELREALLRAGGFEVMLTREEDRFVSLERRVAIAHQAQADVFLSLHADALSEGLAHGAVVYTLSEEASDIASALLAERHDRADLLAGVDLSETDDSVTDILLDLARQETSPRTEAMARALTGAMADAGGPMNRRPLREGAFSVLKAADIPSVLIEIGFLSSPRDLKNLVNPEWRAAQAEAIRAGLQRWRADDAARKGLVRQ